MQAQRTKRKGKKLPLILIVLAIISVWNSQAFSLDVMGPPAAGLEYGMFEAGVEYTNSKMDLKLENGYYTDYVDGFLYDWGDALVITLKDLKINRTYATLGYGVYDNAEIFARLGGLNARFGDTIWEDSEKFYSGPELSGGAGVKLTFYEEDNVKLGGLFQFNSTSFDGELKSPYWPASDFVKIDLSEVQVAVGASCRCNDNLTVYGGPFLHFVDGDLRDNSSQLSADPNYPGLFTSEFNWDIRQDSSLGGYIGAQMNFAENCSFNVEYQQTADARAFGMSLLFRF